MKHNWLILAAVIGSFAPALGQGFAPMALNSFSTPPAKIQSAQVMDEYGNPLGKVTQVKTDAQGKPVALEFQQPNGNVVTVASINVSYEASSNIVVARTAPTPPPLRVIRP